MNLLRVLLVWSMPFCAAVAGVYVGIRTIYRYGQSIKSDTEHWFTFTSDFTLRLSRWLSHWACLTRSLTIYSH